MPGHRRGRRGGDRPAPGHTEARTSGDEPVPQLPVPGTAASCGDADGAADAQQYGAGVGHQVVPSGRHADDGGGFAPSDIDIDNRTDDGSDVDVVTVDSVTVGG
ncbi:hypothetical protein [Streptomyces cyaneofuscatus]|uniref:hypothetical protein n=1 Tax=Streptomyces TaxID=1883 RepID=UPI002E166AA3|nr:hypothetical protein OG366_20805 [Streptomyces cyaneofuscatus]